MDAVENNDALSVHLCIFPTKCPMHVVRQRELSFLCGQSRPMHIQFHAVSQQKAMPNSV